MEYATLVMGCGTNYSSDSDYNPKLINKRLAKEPVSQPGEYCYAMVAEKTG